MFNADELTALHQALSNDARTLYCLGLRPYVNTVTGASQPIHYKQLISLLNGVDETYRLGREINLLFKELLQEGLVALPDSLSLDNSLNGEIISLPLVVKQLDHHHLHANHFAMQRDWQPNDSLYTDLANLVGLIEHTYDANELGEFIIYWQGRPMDSFTEYQWTQKFVHHIKRNRTVSAQLVTKVGNQLVKPVEGIEVDDNARKLVEKYSGKA